MKKTILIISAIFLAVFVFNDCKKENSTHAKEPQITEESVVTALDQATFSWKIIYPGKVSSVVEVSQNSDMSDATRYGSEEASESKLFTATATGLRGGTVYYYRYLIWNPESDFVKEIKNFITKTDIPLVLTHDPTEITRTSAVLNGEIINECGYEVTERGFCFNTAPNPSISNSLVVESTGVGPFSLTVNNLTGGVTYYYRAFAKNTAGIAMGEEKVFNTDEPILPMVTSSEVSDIAISSVVMKGLIVNEGGVPVINCGVCWSTEHDPTIDDHFFSCDQPNASFETKAFPLDPETQYYLRTFATNQMGTAYGEELSITTLPVGIEGTISKTFSVGEHTRVVFSQGNLQYKASTNTWRFAGNQFAICGINNQSIASNYNGYIDLFGWGTSGYDHGAIYYYPWANSFYDEHRLYYAYGSPEYNLNDQSGQADWGYNAISNGGNQENLWRTMTADEWSYLLFTRQTPSNIRFAKVTYNNSYALVVLPDNWQTSVMELNDVNQPNVHFSSNCITTAQMQTMADAGAVFLPVAGWRWGTTVLDLNNASYHTATSNGDYVHGLGFSDLDCYLSETCGRYFGASVRLVHDIP